MELQPTGYSMQTEFMDMNFKIMETKKYQLSSCRKCGEELCLRQM